MAPILSAWRRRIQRYQARYAEELIPEKLQKALTFRYRYGFSQRKAAKEAGVDVAALSAVEQQYGVREVVKVIPRGHMATMLTYTKEYGMVGVDLDSRTASLNGSYLNYVRAAIYETKSIGSGELVARDYPDGSRIGDFTTLVKAHGVNKFEFEANAVYKVVRDSSGNLTFADEPFRDRTTLHWVVNTKELQYLEAVRAGDKMDPYPRR